ncbi:hypothetical protein HDU97_001463 [Phlyctochytrium planicorne]|nr:hypothetical protein HDU97_001463 [Phlyctochytrium planicorne]
MATTQTASDAFKTIESLPLSVQQEVLDLLLQKSHATSQIHNHNDSLQPSDPWLKALRTVESLQNAAGRRNDLIFLKAPEDAQPILELMRELQRDGEVRRIFDLIEVPFEVRDTRSGVGEKLNTRPTPNLFGLIESHLITILVLTPHILVKSSHAPRNSSSTTTHSIHLLPSGRTSSSSSTLSATSHQSSTLNRILAASTLLTSIVETMVSFHSDAILAALDHPDAIGSLENYGSIAEEMGDAVSEIMRGVRRVKEWDGGVGGASASVVWGGVVGGVGGFGRAVRRYVEFAVGVLGREGRVSEEVRSSEEVVRVKSVVESVKMEESKRVMSMPPPATPSSPVMSMKSEMATIMEALAKSGADRGKEE